MRSILLTVLFIAGLALAAYTIKVILLSFAGVLLGILLRTAADWIHDKTGMSPGWGLVVVVFAIASLIAVNFWLFGVNVASQIDELSEAVQRGRHTVEQYLQRYEWSRRVVAQGTSGNQVMSGATSAVSGLVHFIAAMVLMIFVAIYTAANPSTYVRGFSWLLPPKRRARAKESLDRVGQALRWWLLGQLVSMAAVGILTTLAMWSLGVPLPYTLGFLTAILNFIPNIGAISSGALAVALALTKGGSVVLYALAAFAIIQAFEAYVLTPLIQQRAVSLPPALTIIVQAFMGVAVGPIGIALAAPLTVVGLVLTKTLRFSAKIPPGSEKPDSLRPSYRWHH